MTPLHKQTILNCLADQSVILADTLPKLAGDQHDYYKARLVNIESAISEIKETPTDK